MGNVTLQGATSGQITLQPTAVAGTNTLTLPATTGTLITDQSASFQPGVVISGSSSGDALRITQTGTGNALVVEDSANPDSTPFVVDATGVVIKGTTASYDTVAVTTSITPSIQNHGTTLQTSSIGQFGWNANPYYTFNRSNGAVGTYTAVTSTSVLGRIQFNGADGSAFVGAALISGDADGTVSTGIIPGKLVFQTASTAGTLTERMRIDSSGYMQGTVNGLSAGRIPAMQYYRLNADLAGANATGAQNVFGVGVTLVGSTVYEFEAIYPLSKTAGTTSHTIGLGFGGTATINNIGYFVSAEFANNTSTTIPAQGQAFNIYISTASNTTVSAAETTATRAYEYLIKGTVSINAGGTFIPQYTLSAAPGGAYTTAAGAYFRIFPLGASGANVNIGSWA